MRGFAINASNLTKRYGDVTAVDNLNLTVEQGEIFGLLGPNGAGKTTTVLMFLGLTEPSSGTCRICGFDPFREPLKVKSLIGYLAERTGYYENLTVEENLRYITRLNGYSESESRKRIKEALELVKANGYVRLKFGKLSRGMRQRIGIAGILIKKPKIAFLDEPLQGIDPEGKKEILDLFKFINKEKTTIVLLSHELHDVEQICDRVGIMIKGKMVAQSSLKEIERGEGEKWVIEVEAENITEKLFHELSCLEKTTVDKSENLLTIKSEKDIQQEILKIFAENKIFLLDLRRRKYSLDEFYTDYLKRET